MQSAQRDEEELGDLIGSAGQAAVWQASLAEWADDRQPGHSRGL
jgi:hypothetical protein